MKPMSTKTKATMAAAQQLLSKTADTLGKMDPDKLCGITISLQFGDDEEEEAEGDYGILQNTDKAEEADEAEPMPKSGNTPGLRGMK